MSRSLHRSLVLGVASLLATRAAGAQRTYFGLDAGAATVHYDGFASSGAFSISPSVVVDGPNGMLAARGTALRFESGHRSLQGTLAGTTFIPLPGIVRGELSGELGTSSYRDYSPFVHAVARARLHLLASDASGLWIAGTGGRLRYEALGQPVFIGAVGGWARARWALLHASASRAVVGDTAYTDVQGSALWARGRLELAGDAGVRAWSRGGGQGVYGEMSGTFWLARSLALVVSGGRYPTDPVRGSIAGRYVALTLRFADRLPSPFAARPTSTGSADAPLDLSTAQEGTVTSTAPPTMPGPSASHAPTAAAIVGFDVREATGDSTDPPAPDGASAALHVLRVIAPHARAVQLMGDFTDWQPVPLARADSGAWEVTLPIAPGAHRLNVRVDGGAWTVPPGLATVSDDFGGVVALLPIGGV